MKRRRKFRLVFAPQLFDHLGAIDRKYHRLIRNTLNERLCYTPLEATRNRKPLEDPAPFEATWELRFGPQNCFRVFYDVDATQRAIRVLAIGVKERDRLLIAGREIKL